MARSQAQTVSIADAPPKTLATRLSVAGRWDERTWAAVWLLFTLVQGLLYLAVVPPWQGPDEPGHFEYVALLSELGRIPQPAPNTETVPELTLEINASAEAQRFEQFHPNISLRRHAEQVPPLLVGPREAGYQRPTYYLLVLPVYRLFSGQDILVAYYALAITSIVLGGLTVLASALAVRTLLPENRLARLAVPLLVAFWPTQAYMTTRINNDNLATAIAAGVFWLVAEVVRNGPRRASVVSLIGLLAIAAFTKGTVLFLLPVGALALCLSLGRCLSGRARLALERTLLAVGLIGGVGALLALLVPAVAHALMHLAEAIPGHSRSMAWVGSALGTLAGGHHWEPARLAANGRETVHILRSFWAVFGWGSFLLPQGWYRLAAGMGTVALIGYLNLLVRLTQRTLRLECWQWQVLAIFALSILLACVPLAARMVFEPFATTWHGRSLLPLLVPVSLLLVLGWQQLLPARWRGLALQGLAAALLLVQFASFAFVILPRFYR